MTATANQWTSVPAPELPDWMTHESPIATLDESDVALLTELEHEREQETNKNPLTPRQYQIDGSNWLSTPNVDSRCAKILTDPPGLGKTLQAAIAAQKVAAPEHTIIVIAPIYLQPQWYKALTIQYPSDKVASPYDISAKPKKLAMLTRVREQHVRWLVINYEMLRTPDYFAALQLIDYDTIVIDESQHIKNRQSQQSQRLAELAKTKNVIMLSATPIMREADDLFHQLHVLNPYFFASYNDFLRDYCVAESGYWGPKNVYLKKHISVWVEESAPPAAPLPEPPAPPPSAPDWARVDPSDPVSVSKYESQLSTYRQYLATAERGFYQFKLALEEATKPRLPQRRRVTVPVMDAEHGLGKYILGRTYEDVGLELPPLIESKRVIPLEDERLTAYKAMKEHWVAQIQAEPEDIILSAGNSMKVMHSLRMLAAGQNKLQATLDLISETPGPHLIYTEYDGSSAQMLFKFFQTHMPELVKAGNIKLVNGSVPDQDRQAILENPNTSCAIGTMKSIGEGLNLQRYKTVIFFEGDWTPGAMHQRLTRVWRLRNAPTPDGTADHTPVLVYYLLSEGTIDEIIHDRRNDRTNNIRDILKVELSRA